LAITSFHEVLAWGNNDKGQLGLPFNQEFDTPRSVEDLFLVYTPTPVESLSNKVDFFCSVEQCFLMDF